MNLTNNAIKFTQEGAVMLRVDLKELAADRAVIHVAVSDTGIGIPSDKLESIFERFSQADSSTTRTYGGTGLGLAICSQLVAAMGGRIWVESVLGEGSTFHFTLSLKIGKREVREKVENALDDPATADFHGMRVLLVEDDLFNQAVTREVLKKQGCEVVTASNGREAVELFRNQTFDLVLTDIQMPEVDGFETTRRIRALETGKRVPIIAQTAHAFAEDKAQAFACGMDDYVSKPVKPSELKASLKRSTDRAGTRPLPGKASPTGSSPKESLTAETTHADLDALLDRLDGDEDALQEMVDLFFEQIPGMAADLEAAARILDWERLAYLSHAMKGACRTCSAVELAATAEEMEQAVREQDAARTRRFCSRIPKEIHALESFLIKRGLREKAGEGSSEQ